MAVKKKQKSVNLERAASAESVGVSSKEIQALADDFISNGQNIHSIMVLRHGRVACEVYRKPFNGASAHMMYSVSKSFTSAAVGFAVSEGLLSLETKFLDVFPEYRTDKKDEYLEKLNVFDLMTMQGGKEVSYFLDRTSDTWLDDFVSSRWKTEPGTTFSYISENMYVLCAMVRRVTGEKIVDYLMPRLFEPLGIERPYWETCPRGTAAGGWGLMLKTEDMAKFGLLYLNNGKYNGKQILPEWWIKETQKPHADNSVANKDLDGCRGYGLCFWRCGGLESAYRCDGMFSQYIIIMEEYDAVFVCTGGEINQQPMLYTIWRHIPACFIDADENAGGVKVTLPDYEMLPVMPRSTLETQIDGKRIKLSKPVILNVAGFPVSMVTLPAVFMEKDKAGNIDNVTLRFYENEAEMSWSEGDEFNTVHLGMDGEYRRDFIVLGQTKYETFSHAAWLSGNELEVRVRAIETVAERRLLFTFTDGKVKVQPSCMPEAHVMLDNIKAGFKDMVKFKPVHKAADLIFPKVSDIVDSPMYGKY
ncbi:MAG: beta-lactamase family protein [Clostridia bacterium]|nr:beta-lactamase family protein [Clostridia bacterium]